MRAWRIADAMMVSPITTHILDTAKGRPAQGVPITLHVLDAESGVFEQLSAGETDADGRWSKS